MVHQQQLIEELHRKGYRLTPQRLAILDLIIENDQHPSATDIFHQLRELYPTVSLATVYNTLALLVELGAIREIRGTDGGVRYDAKREPHINLYCRRCQRIVDMSADELSELPDIVRRATGFLVESSTFELQGVCQECQKEAGA